MEILIKRIYFNERSTTGALLIGKDMQSMDYLCDTLEPKAINWQVEKKIPGITAIPEGRYRLRMWYSTSFKQTMPYLEDVPHFTGIMIHTGNTVKDTKGCVLVGKIYNENENENGRLTQSRRCFRKLYDRIERAMERGEEVWVTVRSYRGWKAC